MKRKAINGATKFMETGAIIPELEGVSSHSPRQLMKPEPKLLVSTWSDEEKEVEKSKHKVKSNEKDELSELDNEEVKLLENILKKNKKLKKQTKKKTS